MANMTDRLEKLLLDGLLGVTPYTTPTTVYLAFFTADPTDTGDVTNEVSGGAYSRQSLAGKFATATGTLGFSLNTVEIIWLESTEPWGNITHIGIMESVTTGADDMLLWGELVVPMNVLANQTMKFSVGDLELSVA